MGPPAVGPGAIALLALGHQPALIISSLCVCMCGLIRILQFIFVQRTSVPCTSFMWNVTVVSLVIVQ